MDYRRPLPGGMILSFPGMPCTLEYEVGRGSNAIVYKGTYPDLLNAKERHVVLIKELFPFHQNGTIYRNKYNEIVYKGNGINIQQIHRQSFEHGNYVHLQMLKKYPERTGANLNTFFLNNTMYTVLGYANGRSLESEVTGAANNLRQLVVRMLGLLNSLDTFHESGFLHLDIALDNILIVGQSMNEQIMLIDYNSIYDYGAQQQYPVYYSTKTGYSSPEIRRGAKPCPASDLYSATAVFYRCLTGTVLTPLQMNRSVPPEVSDCQALRNMPDTVSDMVQQILHRGLQAMPKKRYQTVAQMREAMQELLDRIDGVGITHWALWESGRRIVNRVIRNNPALSYILKTDELFPSNVFSEIDGSMSTSAYINKLLKHPNAVLLTATGGMGKTTAMLRAVTEQSGYTPLQPAILYISLYDWAESDVNYIHNQILKNLRFKPEQRSFEDARQELIRLMDMPLQTPWGECPTLLLLLDGLNETAGSTQNLLMEILSLSRMQGVSLFISTRSEEAILPFERLKLLPLTESEVRQCLSKHGLLLPESDTIRELIKNPMMLSFFLRSSHIEQRQLSVKTQNELISTYLSALLTKELERLPEDTEERWKIEVAVSFVLPEIAAKLQKHGHPIQDEKLLPCVERCYRLFSSRLLRKSFPQWIGHSKSIRGQAANAEEWYGQIVYELLWKRLGLLVRNVQGNYRIAHQILAEYLTEAAKYNKQRIRKMWQTRLALMTALLFASITVGRIIYIQYIRPVPYNEAYAKNVFSYGITGYIKAGLQYEAIRKLTDRTLGNPESYSEQLAEYENTIYNQSLFSDSNYAEQLLQKMLQTGDVVPWSEKILDETYYIQLINLEQERAEEYTEFVSVLTYIMDNKQAYLRYGDSYLQQLSKLIDIDADITATLYQIVCEPHMVNEYIGDIPWEPEPYERSIALCIRQNEHLTVINDLGTLRRNLNTLYGIRTTIKMEINSSGVVVAYEDRNEIKE